MKLTVRFFNHEQVYHPMSLGEGATPVVGHTRSLIAGAVIFAWRRVSGDVAPTPREWHSAIIVGILLLVLSNGCVV